MAEGSTIDGANRVQARPPPPPPPPPPKADPAQAAQQRTDTLAAESAAGERRGAQGQELRGTRAARPGDPAMPGERPAPVQRPVAAERPAPAAETGGEPEGEPDERSALARFGSGLWEGVKAGASGLYEGAKALVTDPVGTAEAAGEAAKRAGAATADYGQRLWNQPGETLQQTGDFLQRKANDVANAKAEDWGKAIGETAVGAVGGYGAGKALQGVKALRAVRAADDVANKAPDVVSDGRPPVDAVPDAKAPIAADTAPPSSAAPSPALAQPKQTEPFGNQKITEKGVHGQGGLTRAEGEAINKFRDALNAHNDRFGLNRDLPPSSGTGRDMVAQTNRAGDKLANVHAEIRRTDEAVNKHLSPDDLAGRVKEQRGVSTGFDHVKETQNAYENLKKSVARIDDFLARNPQLPDSQARYLLERRNGHAGLIRTLENDLGFR